MSIENEKFTSYTCISSISQKGFLTVNKRQMVYAVHVLQLFADSKFVIHNHQEEVHESY